MLLYFKFNNFYSFLNEAEVSFQLGKQATKSDYDFEIETTQDNLRLNKVMAVLGANGSGKTQTLKALGFLLWFMVSSAKFIKSEEEIPLSSFAHNHDNASFELGFLLENSQKIYEEYRYILVVNKKNVIEEKLYKKTSKQFSYIFIREIKNNQLIYKNRNFLAKNIADDIKANASLLSFASLFDNQLAMTICNQIYNYQSNVDVTGRVLYSQYNILEISQIFYDNKLLLKTAEKLLQDFDTGISKVSIKETLIMNSSTKQYEDKFIPYSTHNYGDNHSFELSFFEESNGTQSAFILLGLILPILHQGGFAIIDELDNDLHPHLLPVILDLFRSKHTNPHNAQLIFSCHTPEVFNILNKHQIYLVEKYQQQSETWRLDEVEKVRNDDNLYAKYMAGAFDAVPNV